MHASHTEQTRRVVFYICVHMSVAITIKEEEAGNLRGSGGEGLGAWGESWREMMPLYFN